MTAAVARMLAEPERAAGDTLPFRSGQRGRDVQRVLGNRVASALFQPQTAGLPLDPATRGRMEAQLRTPLADARVHVGPWATQSTRALGASAYTLGRDIVFAPGRYAPGTRTGDLLLGHELAHVVQQRGGGRGGVGPGASFAAETAAWNAVLGGDGGVAPLGRQGIQLAEKGAEGAAGAAKTADAGPRVHPAVRIVLMGQSGALLLVSFTQGFVDGLIAEEVANERLTKLQSRLMGLFTSPLDALKLYGGYMVGIGKGLISPITDLIDVIKLAVEFQMKFNEWVIAQGVALFGGASGSILAQARKVSEAAEDAFDRASLAFVNALEDPDFLGNLLDRLQLGLLQKSYEGGTAAAKAYYEYWELPWFDVGEKMGYVVGMILLEVVLAYFSAGIANAVKAAVSAVAKLGRAGAKVVQMMKKVVQVIDDLWNGLRAFGKAATKTVVDELAKSFGKLWDEFKKLWDLVMGKLDELAPSPAGLTTGGVQVPIPDVPGPTASLMKGTGKGGGAPSTVTTKGTPGSRESSVATAAERERMAPKPSLSTAQQAIADELITQHPGGLHPRVAAEAVVGAERGAGAGGKGADVILLGGGGREVSVHTGGFTMELLGSHLIEEAGQAGTTQIYLQINTQVATRAGLLQMMPRLQRSYIDLDGVFVKIFGPNGEAWWTGVFRFTGG